MIPRCCVNYLVTLAWGSFPWLHSPAVCSNVHSTHDVVVAIPDTAVASTLSRQVVEPREQENTLAESAFPFSPNRSNSRVSLSCMLKDAPQVSDGARVSNNANRRQFHVALLEDCSFFAHLVLRHVRAGGNSSRSLLDRASPRLNIAKVSQTAPRSSSNILPRQPPMEERVLQPEAASPFLQTLWVEVGCRHAQTLAPGKERHEYRENSNPAL